MIGYIISPSLQQYIETKILPQYNGFDKAHRRTHADVVIRQSLELAEKLKADTNIAYTVAAYHDLGLAEGRDIHHLASGKMVRADVKLKEWFNDYEIETIAQAVEDHRASSKNPPRSIYGRIVAEADRYIETEDIIQRTIQFGLDHYPELSRDEHYRRMVEHLKEKYGRGGYLKLWFEESPNYARLERLRCVIDDESQLKEWFDKLFPQLKQREDGDSE